MSKKWIAGIALLAVGCGGGSQANTGRVPATIENPTGTCQAPNDGARAGYHHPQDSVWLPDCNNVLAREYWRVFAQSNESAYVIPRPDGEPRLAAACGDQSHELAPLVDKYALCQSASSPALVDRVNDMLPADALTITHYLHTQLEFVAEATTITPFPMPSDIIDACNLHPAQNSAELSTLCEREQSRLDSGNDIGFSYEGPGAVELAARLNELYGITPSPS